MDVLRTIGTINDVGELVVNVNTALPAGHVELLVIIQPQSIETTNQSPYDFSNLVDSFSWQGDAVAEQRRIRAEWSQALVIPLERFQH